MSKLLTQEEIDALLSQEQGEEKAAAVVQADVQEKELRLYDFVVRSVFPRIRSRSCAPSMKFLRGSSRRFFPPRWHDGGREEPRHRSW
jgi:hypothetical protein